MDSNDYFEKTYLEYYFLKEVLERDKQYHIDGFVKNDIEDKNIDISNINIFSLLIKYLLDEIDSFNKFIPIVIHNDVENYKIKGYKSIILNKNYRLLSKHTNNFYSNSLYEEVILYGFYSLKEYLFNGLDTFVKNKNYYEIKYDSKSIIDDFKELYKNIQTYKINKITHFIKEDTKKIFFKNESFSEKYNKSFHTLKDFNDVLKYKITELYNSSSYSAFFNSHIEYLYETIINLNKPELVQDSINSLKSKNDILKQKIFNDNTIIINTLNEIVIRNLTKLRFPNLFNTNHKDCLFRNDKEFNLNELPDKYKNVILLEHEKNIELIRQVSNNKCEHKNIILYKNSGVIDFEAFSKLEEFIDNDQQENIDKHISCKLCGFDLICPHEYQYIKLLKEKSEDISSDKAIFNYDKHKNQVIQIITNTFSSDTSLQYKFYCKICGGFLSDDDNALESFHSLSMVQNTTIKSVDEELKKYIIREGFYIVSSYLDIESSSIEQKNIVWAITDIVIGHLSEINQKISKKKVLDESILLKFHIKIIIFTIIILLIVQTNKISYKNFTKSNALKDLLNQTFTIFIKYASSTISKLQIQYIDIKSLIIEYYKLIVNNTITFNENTEKDINIKYIEDTINYKVLKSYLSLYLGVKTNDIEVILNKNIIQPTKNKDPVEENLYGSIRIDKYDNKLLSNPKFQSYLNFVQNLKSGLNNNEPIDKVLDSKAIKYETIIKYPYSSLKFGLNDKKNITYSVSKIDNIDIKRFYVNYTYKCPEGEFHSYNNDDDTCEKCKLTSSIINSYDNTYFTKYKKKYIDELNKQKNIKQKTVDSLINNYKKPMINKPKLDTTLNKETINIISNLFNIDIEYFINLGAIEGIEYDKKTFSSIKIDLNERILKLTNYLLYLIVEYNKFRSKDNTFPKISTNLIDMIESYKNIMSEPELINLLLNTIYSNILNIYNIDSKNNELFMFIDTIVHNIIRFDEIFSAYDYSSIKYLLRKSKGEDDVVIDTDQYETNEINEYEDIFGSDLFDESFDGPDEDDSSNQIKTSDY